jgi:hypothetical protein
MQIERLLEQVARHHNIERRDLPASITDVAIAYLDSTPVEAQTRENAEPQPAVSAPTCG